jgi:hypothetical protein
MRTPTLLLLLALLISSAVPVSAEPIAVRFPEGVARGFPVLRSTSGEVLAHGDLTQLARGDTVTARLVFRFLDGSIHDETVVFDQREVFTLLSYRLLQRGPSFPEALDAALDRETGRYVVRHRTDEDSPEEVVSGRFTLPADAANGLLTILMKNLPAGKSATVQLVAFTPQPRLVAMLLAPVGDDTVSVAGAAVRATRYQIKPQLGLLASMLITDLPDVRCWLAAGEAPGFLKFEGPLYFMGPVWRIE